MARRPFGGGGDAVVLNYQTGAPVPFAQGTAWTARSGGSQITDLADEGGTALPSSLIVADASGAIAPFLGPADGTGQMWVDFSAAGGGSRYLLTTTDLEDRVDDLEGGGGGGGGSIDAGDITSGTLDIARIPTGTSSSTVAVGNDTRITGAQQRSTLTTKGDLYVATAFGTVTRLGVGTNNQVLTADSGETAGVKWATPSGGGGGAAPNTIVVAASGSGVTGDYQCDGTADQVEINAALADLQSGDGGIVQLTAGTYNLTSPILVEGFDDVDVEQDLYLRGVGPGNTTIAVGSGVSCGIRLGKSVRAHVSDLGLAIIGASDGIQAVASTEPAGLLRSAWLSTIARVQVIGPFDGSDSGWAFDLDNVFRASIRDIEVNGTTNGMRWYNSDAGFNAGDSTIDRCFIDIGSGGNNGVAYHLESAAGNMNQLLFTTCHGIGNPAATGTVCWKFSGAGNTSHVRTVNCNAEQFVKTVEIASSCSDIEVGLVHVTLNNGATLIDAAGWNNRASCGLAYIEPAAVVTIVNDTNGYGDKPNIWGPIDVYADTGATANVALGTYGVLRDTVTDGASATIAAALRRLPTILPARTVALADAATIATDASRGDVFRVTQGGNRTLGAPTNPTDGQRCRWEIGASGSSRTLTLTTGAGGFVLASGVSLPGNPTAGIVPVGNFITLDCVYSSTADRWRVLTALLHTA